jgi:hypothetical protein
VVICCSGIRSPAYTGVEIVVPAATLDGPSPTATSSTTGAS